MIKNPFDRMSDTTESTSGADGCDHLPESLKVAYTELEPRPGVFTLLFFFFARGSAPSRRDQDREHFLAPSRLFELPPPAVAT